ncbi:zwei Ig domain protein zig-4-like [Watersipora subatra]|uniref:zwei Ig domain protein zig-4-like n=1 Tax=Watersipora subatra TaxID=2589382 RepID=UPI00355C99FA
MHWISEEKSLAAVLASLTLITAAMGSPVKFPSAGVRITKRNVSAVDKVVPAGNDIELECKANGPTPPLIHWLYNGEHVEQSPLDHLSSNLMAPGNFPNDRSQNYYASVSTLIIKETDSSKAGIYTCVADLEDERQTKSFNIQVTQPLLGDDSSQQIKRTEAIDEDPRIYLYTEQVYEFEGVSTQLICRATQGFNKPPPSITWTINDQPITNNTAGFQLMSNGDLKILRTSNVLHMAEVKCIAVGSNGKTDVRKPFIYMYEPTE